MDRIADLLLKDELEKAKEAARVNYPFEVKPYVKRSLSKKVMLSVFIRDGFMDRYSGEKLYHPGFLRMLHEILPAEFPFHKNGKRGKCHDIFWDKMPSIDHLVPIYRGGTNELDNLVTTSMKRNMAKNNSLLEEIGWKLFPIGDVSKWDGCTKKFLDLCEKYPSQSRYVNDWRRTTARMLQELGTFPG